MTDATTDFFEELGARGHERALEKVKATFRFELMNGKRKTRWFVEVDRGNIAVSHKNGKADCVARADKDIFDGIAAGKVNAFAAVLRGTLQVDGDAELMALFQRLFPAPPRRRS